MTTSFASRLAALALCPIAVAAWADVCDTGRQQSPINISATTRQKLPALEFVYPAAPLVLANDGHTLRIRIGNKSHLNVGSQAFALTQVHFHTPAGDQMAGERFPMGAHFLHRHSSGQLLAMVVFFRVGQANKAFDTLLPAIPRQKGGNHPVANATIDLKDLLPLSKAYYRYKGSLTASPCTEGVEWLVLKEPITLSGEQLSAWKKRFADNARVPQPLNGRIVLESS